MEIVIAGLAAATTAVFTLATEARGLMGRNTQFACRLMFLGAALLCYVSIFLAQQTGGDWVARVWYVGATLGMVGLLLVCSPWLLARCGPLLLVASLFTVFIIFSDTIVAGVVVAPSALSPSGKMVTRLPGEYYRVWLAFIFVVLALQIVLLVMRSFFGTDARDQNAALWLLLCTLAVHGFTLLLILEMTKENPSFNSVTVLPASILVFCAGVAYTETQYELIPLNFRAFWRDKNVLNALAAVLSSETLLPEQKLHRMRELGFNIECSSGTMLNLGDNQAVCIDLTKYYWCKQLTAITEQTVAAAKTPVWSDL